MASEGYVDEILCSNEVDKSKLSRIDLILNTLQEAIQSDEFSACQDEFADKNCEKFTENGDLPPECMQLYNQYVGIIEDHLVKKVEEVVPNFDFEELIPVIKNNKNSDDFRYSDVFEFLNAALDFNEFRNLMASYNKGKDISLAVTTTELHKL